MQPKQLGTFRYSRHRARGRRRRESPGRLDLHSPLHSPLRGPAASITGRHRMTFAAPQCDVTPDRRMA